MAEFVRWFRAQYLASIGLEAIEGGAAYKKFLDTVNSLSAPTLSGALRASRFNQLRFRYPLSPQGYTAAVFSVAWGETRTIAGHAWWRSETDEYPEYICAAYTFDSRDGEYRAPFIRGSAFRELFTGVDAADDEDVPAVLRAGFAAFLAPIEEQVMLLVAKGTLSLAVDAIPGEAAGRLGGLDRLAIEVLTVLLARDGRRVLAGVLERHASPAFVDLVRMVEKEAPGLFTRLAFEDYARFTDFSQVGVENNLAVMCGQKLTPMTLREVMSPWDAAYPGWRELLAADVASDLVLNKIAPSFVFSNQWTYVGGDGAGGQDLAPPRVYENPAMLEKFARSAAADLATDSLRQARREATGATEPTAGPPAGDRPYHLAEFDAQIYQSIEYAQGFLVQSGISLVRTMEHAGVALGSLAHRLRLTPVANPAFGRLFSDDRLASGFLFGLAYGCHCLHSRAGIVHADLHANNIVVYETGWAFRGVPSAEGKEPTFTRVAPDNSVVAYVLARGERDTYIFETEGLTGCIIDFSRAILGPGEAEKRLEARHGARYVTRFRRDQANRILRTLHRYIPAFVAANQERIKAALLGSPEKSFKILAAVDFIAVARAFGGYLSDEAKQKTPAVSAEAMSLARRLEKAARDFLVVRLGDLLENPANGADEFPGDVVLPNVFGAYTYARRVGAVREKGSEHPPFVLADVWNLNRPLAWSGADYAKFPPWARLDEIEKHLGGERLTAFIERGSEPFLESLRSAPAVRVWADRIRATLDARDGPAVSTQSSWVND